jgi:hypothetical protein
MWRKATPEPPIQVPKTARYGTDLSQGLQNNGKKKVLPYLKLE